MSESPGRLWQRDSSLGWGCRAESPPGWVVRQAVQGQGPEAWDSGLPLGQLEDRGKNRVPSEHQPVRGFLPEEVLTI